VPDASSAARRLVVWDFDGTVCLGDDPVRAYASAAGARLDEAAAADLDSRLTAWLAGGTADEAIDGYALVASIASGHGLDASALSAAYRRSREALHDGRIVVQAPEGLAALLAARPADVRCALVTNAPVDGIGPVLERIGLANAFDVLVGDAGKPAGMPARLQRLLDRFAVPADALLSVGDIWVNDLEPVAALGGTTALVDRFGRGGGSPDLRAASLRELYPDLAAWWSA
jgi:FMN phosphatase YigB (HAD superfamily)